MIRTLNFDEASDEQAKHTPQSYVVGHLHGGGDETPRDSDVLRRPAGARKKRLLANSAITLTAKPHGDPLARPVGCPPAAVDS